MVATEASAAPPRPTFGKQLFGYNKAQVDQFLAEAQLAINALKDLVGATNDRAPFERVGSEVATVLRSLADSVAEVQRDAERSATGIVAAAETDASEIRERALQEAAGLRAHAEQASEAAERARAAAQEQARVVVAQAETRVAEMLRAQQVAADARLMALDTYRRRAEDGLQAVLDQIVAALNDVRHLGQVTVTVDDGESAFEVGASSMNPTSSSEPAQPSEPPNGTSTGEPSGAEDAPRSAEAESDATKQLDEFIRVLARLGETHT